MNALRRWLAWLCIPHVRRGWVTDGRDAFPEAPYLTQAREAAIKALGEDWLLYSGPRSGTGD